MRETYFHITFVVGWLMADWQESNRSSLSLYNMLIITTIPTNGVHLHKNNTIVSVNKLQKVIRPESHSVDFLTLFGGILESVSPVSFKSKC